MLERPKAQELWVRTIAATHRNLISVLKDERTSLSTSEGNVVLDLQPLLIQLGERVAIVGDIDQRLQSNPDAGKITIIKSNQLERAAGSTHS